MLDRKLSCSERGIVARPVHLTRKSRESPASWLGCRALGENEMVADSDSRIAWHRAQVRRHRDTLRRIETARFTVGENSDPRAIAQARKTVAELKDKIRQSEQIIALHDRQTRRPLATDLRSLSTIHWSHWNSYGTGPR